jgi:hypothetical protein
MNEIGLMHFEEHYEGDPLISPVTYSSVSLR